MREYLDAGDFNGLFRLLGWDNPIEGLTATAEAKHSEWTATSVADKRGVTVWLVEADEIPPRSVQHQIVKAAKRYSRDQLMVFASTKAQLWLWPEQRPSGVGHRLVDHYYRPHHSNDALLQRLRDVCFTLAEEPKLTATKVLERVRRSFNVEKVTKSFFREFKKHHEQLATHIEGIPRLDDQRWYASVLMNRLMFVYFIQRKGFVANDTGYLRNRLAIVRERLGKNQFYSFFRQFLLPLFHEGLGSPPPVRRYGDDPVIEEIIGEVPYVNGGIFESHRLEETYDIQIPDTVFESLFDFFDEWRWHLDERPSGHDKEINPDILGFIFEQYVNKKQKGAYYTKPDVTGYMATSTIIPALVDRLMDAGLADPCELLPNSGDDYLHDAMGYGCDKPLPEGDLPPSEFPDATLEIALPGERWCDVTHRRKRYAEQKELVDSGKVANINDTITQNLDIAALLADYFYTLTSADECQRAFEVLRSLTVCDPTVGSGAFLLAALDVLDPLYSTVFYRAEEIAVAGGGGGGGGQPTFLAEAQTHPSKRYWLLKTLCLNNLYGVDLMAEAAEIAKLRLFLKLAVQLDDSNHIEPLPDLDFNIKSGNLLVGIADEDDIKRRFSDRGVLPFGLDPAMDAAQSVAAAYDDFIAAQAAETGAEGEQHAKGLLQGKIKAISQQVDAALYEMRNESQNFEEWRKSHQPFHWFAEFPTVWRNGGFDVIIGNPPYIAVSKKKRDQFNYKWVGYKTEKCPDIYAVCVERASTLVNNQGRFAMIVMHSLCFGEKYVSLRSYLSEHFPCIWVSSFALIPDCLFYGSAKVRNSIIIGSQYNAKKIFITRCQRWLTESRSYLFPQLKYAQMQSELQRNDKFKRWPFCDSQSTIQAFSLLHQSQKNINDSLILDSQFKLAVADNARYMIGIYPDPPLDILEDGSKELSKKYNWLYFLNSIERNIARLVLNGRWGYLWWLMWDDEYHVKCNVLTRFPADIKGLTSLNTSEQLIALAEQLNQELPLHLAYKKNASRKVARLDINKCRHITDEADWLLAQAWGLTREQYEAAGNLRDRMTFGNKD